MCLKIVIFCHAYVIMKGEGGGREGERERERCFFVLIGKPSCVPITYLSIKLRDPTLSMKYRMSYSDRAWSPPPPPPAWPLPASVCMYCVPLFPGVCFTSVSKYSLGINQFNWKIVILLIPCISSELKPLVHSALIDPFCSHSQTTSSVQTKILEHLLPVDVMLLHVEVGIHSINTSSPTYRWHVKVQNGPNRIFPCVWLGDIRFNSHIPFHFHMLS